MKRALLLIYLITMTGCIQQLSTNIRQSNELMQENLDAMAESRQAIEANTKEIKRSTESMQAFQFVFPIFFGIIIVILAYIAIKYSRKIVKYFKK